MKSQKEIKDKLNYLEDSLSIMTDKIGEINDIEESLILECEIDIVESRISLLKWILEETDHQEI